MKLTKANLKQIIKEELQKEVQGERIEDITPPELTPKEEQPADLQSILAAIMPEVKDAIATAIGKYISDLEKIKK